ncbi:MAG: thioredoxin domain-containing protein [Pseudomonadota bacterium]
MTTRRRLLAASALAPLVGGLGLPRPAYAAFPIKVLGDPSAPVEIREYSSLTCPHCADLHANAMKPVREAYIDTGKAKLVYRDFPLDLRALLAAATAHCAGEARFFAFLEMLFAEQQRWAGAPTDAAARERMEASGLVEAWLAADRTVAEIESLRSVAGSVNALVDLARFGGMDPAETTACLGDFALVDWILEAQREGQEVYDVRSTPTLIIDGATVTGAQPFDVIAESIDAALAQKS